MYVLGLFKVFHPQTPFYNPSLILKGNGANSKKGGAAAEGGGRGVLDEKEMKRMLKEKLSKMTPEEREEWLEESPTNTFPIKLQLGLVFDFISGTML